MFLAMILSSILIWGHLWECHWKGTWLRRGWIPICGSMVILILLQLTFYLGQWRGLRLVSTEPLYASSKTFIPVYTYSCSSDHELCISLFRQHISMTSWHGCCLGSFN
ncbi:hypothetical protein EZV62_004253 [Acer yangbiense]|uniref:Uncharacterized protein n=1 Tax=Acer yangbiense TaxID=1000413 RepID=A0A5C7IJI0_9ROSI|nr:hypothetical protein EZV62_004253 [Acer yangbiense]